MDNIGLAIEKALRTLILTLCQLVYSMIVFFFDIFEKIGTASIVSDTYIMEVYERVGLILGLFMLFRITFTGIQYVINPDLISDKKSGMGNIVKKAIIVIVLLGTTPYLFEFAFKVQNLVIEKNVLPKIIVGAELDPDESFGINLVKYTFFNFYTRNPDAGDLCSETEYGAMKKHFSTSGSLEMTKNCIDRYNEHANGGEGAWAIDFDYHGILPLIVGCALLWMIVMYTLQVAIRAFQLAYLQLIAPIPIMLYLDPKKDDQLQKWFKQCTTTYLDLFIRVAIIYFVVFVIEIIMSEDFFNTIDVSGGFFSNFYISLVLIIALLIFAKKVPDLFKELFPMGGGAAKFDFGLSPKKVLNDTMAAGLIGGVAGAVGATASNAVHGFMNMRKAWNKNPIDKKWSDLTLGEKKDLKASGIDMEAYNSRRRAQMASRFGAVAGATGKTAASMAGGFFGGAKAGLKTKDITKAGEAVKTANKNREERELRADAGYHWYNPLPTMRDGILEFAGESGDTIKNRNQAVRDSRKRDADFEDGKRIYDAFGIPKEPGSKEIKLDENRAFKNDKYVESYKELGAAKRAAKAAEITLSEEQANLNAAYNHVGPDREDVIARAKERYNIAYGNAKATQGKLELAKAKHDSNKKIFADDARVEDLFKYYSDITGDITPLESITLQGNQTKTSGVTQQSSSPAISTVLENYTNGNDSESVHDSGNLSYNVNSLGLPNVQPQYAPTQSQQQSTNTRPMAFNFSLDNDSESKSYGIPLDISIEDLQKIVDDVSVDVLEKMVDSSYYSVSEGIGKVEDQDVVSKKNQIWVFLESALDEKRSKQKEEESSASQSTTAVNTSVDSGNVSFTEPGDVPNNSKKLSNIQRKRLEKEKERLELEDANKNRDRIKEIDDILANDLR